MSHLNIGFRNNNPSTSKTFPTTFSTSNKDWINCNCALFCIFFCKIDNISWITGTFPTHENACSTHACNTRNWSHLHTFNIFKEVFTNFKASWRAPVSITGVCKSSDIFVWNSTFNFLIHSLAASLIWGTFSFFSVSPWSNGDTTSLQSWRV